MRKITYVLKGFWAATGFKLVGVLAAVCGALLTLGKNVGDYAFHNMLMVSLAISIGAPAILFLHYLAGTRPALPYQCTTHKSMYVPGVRNFDGTYGHKEN